MRIVVFGAAGMVGRQTVAEALLRHHHVTAVVRNEKAFTAVPPGADVRIGDAADARAVEALSRGNDVVISATRPAVGRESELITTAKALLDGVARAGVRLILVGGAASLRMPGLQATTLVQSAEFPKELREIALACAAQHEVCRADARADWTYVSPPAQLEPGKRTGRYRLGTDELLLDADGDSRISVEDFAVALIDEAEHPKHRRTRFTVAN